VINPPQAGILAVGAAQPTVVPRASGAASGAEWEVRQVLSATLSADHRVVDGAVGAQFLQALRSRLENPLKLLL
jgi:pyruvate dehydrogenase E2 component (dihydrolipoamide acetyltransferase)